MKDSIKEIGTIPIKDIENNVNILNDLIADAKKNGQSTSDYESLLKQYEELLLLADGAEYFMVLEIDESKFH